MRTTAMRTRNWVQGLTFAAIFAVLAFIIPNVLVGGPRHVHHSLKQMLGITPSFAIGTLDGRMSYGERRQSSHPVLAELSQSNLREVDRPQGQPDARIGMHCNDSTPLYSFNYYSKPRVIQADGTYYQIS